MLSPLSNRKLLSHWIDVSGNRSSFPKPFSGQRFFVAHPTKKLRFYGPSQEIAPTLPQNRAEATPCVEQENQKR